MTSPLQTSKQCSGNHAERQAEALLRDAGLQLLTRNYLCKQGEVDLIMLDKDCLVFVEVRYRKNARFGSALETVNYSKQKKIIAASQYYLLTHPKLAKLNQRFDVVGITGDDAQWVSNAFLA